MPQLIDLTGNTRQYNKQQVESIDPEVKAWQREIDKRRKLKLSETKLRPIVEQIYDAVKTNNIDKLRSGFIQWALVQGFHNEEHCNSVEVAINNADFKILTRFVKYITNQYLKYVEGTNTVQRSTKFKRVQYQFETQPKSKKQLESEELIATIIKYLKLEE